MKRYLAFGSQDGGPVFLADLLGDHDELIMAKAAVEDIQPDGFTVHLSGAVLDTKLGMIHEWDSDGTHRNQRWRNPRNAAA